MDTFVWDQNMLTGITEVDEQHHSLVDLFNELNQGFFHGGEQATASHQQVFERLIDYAHLHFSHEEALMRTEGIDARHIHVHQQLHEQFVQQVHTMWETRQRLNRPAETIIGFLTAWLGLHVLGMDQSMARQIGMIRQGHDSQTAFDLENRQADPAMQSLLRMVSNLYRVLAEQNNDLATASRLLEQRVQERTRELQQVNEELVIANETLKAFSRTDGLLGIPNRKYFDERLAEELATARRQQWPLAVLMMDVDHFKRYNDTRGHQAGDDCLKTVATTVRRTLHRATDFLARYGGEELVALLPNTDGPTAHRVAERIVQALQALALPHGASDVAPHVTLSIGVASRIPATVSEGVALLREADAALYEAKHSGRNRAVLAAVAGQPAT